jgi:phosphoribosylamine---glycine ligase
VKILVIGNGGREHALAWRLARTGHAVLAAPGNPGIEQVARCFPIGTLQLDKLVELATTENVDLVVVGPEAPLVAGLADRLRAAKIATFGPGADGARLEGSKAFSKEFFAKYGIPTARFRVVTKVEDADAAIAELGGRVVVKADGLAAGKGVVVAADAEEAKRAARDMIEARTFGEAGETVIIEERILGREVSVLALTDGRRLEVMPAVEDHKTIFDDDKGPNTGGMGTVSPAWTNSDIEERITREILQPTIRGLVAEGIDYRGVLYAGVMVDRAGAPWLLEYNVRFGDPETQPIMARMVGDLGKVLLGAARGELPVGVLTWDARVAVCVVVASAGYPSAPKTGDAITGVPEATDDVVVFHAGTARKDEALVTSGGRVFGVTSLGISVQQARERAYAAVDAIELAGKQARRDIGARKG